MKTNLRLHKFLTLFSVLLLWIAMLETLLLRERWLALYGVAASLLSVWLYFRMDLHCDRIKAKIRADQQILNVAGDLAIAPPRHPKDRANYRTVYYPKSLPHGK